MCCSKRHGGNRHAIGAETYPDHDPSRYCKCLGIDKGHTDNPAEDGKCCGAASGGDGLCDRCRNTCQQLDAETPAAEQVHERIDPLVVLTGV